jgi:hypothetical protein
MVRISGTWGRVSSTPGVLAGSPICADAVLSTAGDRPPDDKEDSSMRSLTRSISLVPVLLVAAGLLLAGPAAAAQHSSALVSARLASTQPLGYGSQSSSYAFGGLTNHGGPVVLDVTRNGRRIKRADGALDLRCSNGDAFIIVDSWRNIPISRRGSFRVSAQDTDPGPDGTTVDASFSFAGKLNRRRTRLTGTWRAQLVERSPDGSQISCDSGTLRFAARR